MHLCVDDVATGIAGLSCFVLRERGCGGRCNSASLAGCKGHPADLLRLIDATHSFAEWRATGYLIGGQQKYEFEHAVHGRTMNLSEVICLLSH